MSAWVPIIASIAGGLASGAANKTSSSQLPTLTGGQQAMLDRLSGMILPELGQSGPVYQGQRVAGMTPMQLQAWDMAGRLPEQAAGLQGASVDAIQRATSPISTDWMNPIFNAATDFFNSSIAPQVMNNFAATGSADSGMAQANLAGAGASLAQQLAGQLAPYYHEAQMANRQNLMNAPGQYGNVLNLGLNALSPVAAAGGEQRGYNQQMLDTQRQIWSEYDPLANRAIQMMGPALGTSAFENVLTQSTNPLMSGMAAGLGALANNWSQPYTTPTLTPVSSYGGAVNAPAGSMFISGPVGGR